MAKKKAGGRRREAGGARQEARNKVPVRRKLAAKRPVKKKAAPKLAGVTTTAVLKATGRTWEEWLKVLDRAGARRMAHKDIAALLARKFELPNWWSQMVSVGYEQ